MSYGEGKQTDFDSASLKVTETSLEVARQVESLTKVITVLTAVNVFLVLASIVITLVDT
jgi:hypothetical protein